MTKKLGRRKYSRGHGVDGVWIFDAVKRHTRKILLCWVIKRNRTELENIMFKYILPYSVIYSGCWKVHLHLKLHYFARKTVNHLKELLNKIGNVHTNTIEENWSGLKRNVHHRSRTALLVKIYLLKYMLWRNQPTTMLKDLLYISLFYKYE